MHRQMERANQDLNSALRCVTAHHPASRSTHLPWVEYSHNSLPSAATGMSPLMVAYGYQTSLFPSQEHSVAVSSVKEHLRCCHRVWRHAREALSRTAQSQLADKHRIPAPDYHPGQKVWLATCDLPIQVDSRKLAPRHIGTFAIVRIINPAVCLKLPDTVSRSIQSSTSPS